MSSGKKQNSSPRNYSSNSNMPSENVSDRNVPRYQCQSRDSKVLDSDVSTRDSRINVSRANSAGSQDVSINSDVDTSPVRVRDMINLYNLATEKNQELSQAKSMYFGVNKFGSERSANQSNQSLGAAAQPQLEEEVYYDNVNDLNTCDTSCQNASELIGISNSNIENVATVSNWKYDAKSSGTDSDSLRCSRGCVTGFKILTTEGETSFINLGEAGERTETEYKSKTTIRKTAEGVRVIIDIYFNKDQDIDIVGSRIETNIPKSRILEEFQKQAQSNQRNSSEE